MGPLSNPLSLSVCFSCTRINEERTDGASLSLFLYAYVSHESRKNEERTDGIDSLSLSLCAYVSHGARILNEEEDRSEEMDSIDSFTFLRTFSCNSNNMCTFAAGCCTCC